MGRIGIIGGSGFYDMEDLKSKKWVRVKTPFGRPSDKFLLGKYKNKEVVFLPRHGRGHKISPTDINYRANIYGMKYLDVKRIISVTACGSLKEKYRPLDFIIPDQFVDRTSKGRKSTFFEKGIVAHVGFAHPVCTGMAKVLYDEVRKLNVRVHLGGTYINMEGPQFSTLAESNLYRSLGFDIIGMTNMTEARLAREAEICYVTLAAVTDYDCWHEQHEKVTVDMILDNLKKNIQSSKMILRGILSAIDVERKCSCQEALRYSIATNKKAIPNKLKKRLDIIIGRYM